MKKNRIIWLFVGAIMILTALLLWINYNTFIPTRESGQAFQLKELANLPYENDHFKIQYHPNNNVLLIVPKITFESRQAPQAYFAQNWTVYESYAQEAFAWARSNGLNDEFLEKYGIEIEWWGREWWPIGRIINPNN